MAHEYRARRGVVGDHPGKEAFAITAQLGSVRRALLALMARTAHTIDFFLAPLRQETATTLHDGGDGWTVLEVLCHLRDFDGYFRGRAIMMTEQDTPQFPAYDRDRRTLQRPRSARRHGRVPPLAWGGARLLRRADG